jgi:DNA-directed RNA polymerase specialized sigma24 family protein
LTSLAVSLSQSASGAWTVRPLSNWRRLLIYARTFERFSQHRGGGLDAEDLVHTAVERFLAGERRWNPARVSLLDFLAGVIRSLASAEADKARRRGPHAPLREAQSTVNDWDSPDYPRQLVALRASLGDAPHLQRVLDGLLADAAPREMAADLNVSVATVYRYIH